jgi:hypothetical protein
LKKDLGTVSHLIGGRKPTNSPGGRGLLRALLTSSAENKTSTPTIIAEFHCPVAGIENVVELKDMLVRSVNGSSSNDGGSTKVCSDT